MASRSAVFVNKMDIGTADHDALLQSLRRELDERCIDFSQPQSQLQEELSLCDDALLDEYLASGRVSDAQIASAVSHRKVFPCFFGSALKREGVLVYVEYMESAPSGNPTLSKTRKYAGIGAALLAFGIQLPIDYGYGGAIYLKAKTTQLREHYMRNYGAIPFSRFDPFLLLIDGDAARELFGRYLKEV